MTTKRRFARAAAFAGLLVVAACGFTPAYGPQGGAAQLTGAVRADDPGNRDAFDFVAALEARLGMPGTPRYALSYTIWIYEEQKISNRMHVVGEIGYVLTDIASGAQLVAGRVQNFVAYSSVSGSTSRVVSLPKTVADARLRLLRSLADRVVLELIAAAPA